MELHVEPNTIECLTPSPTSSRSDARVGCKGFRLIDALRNRAGPELWIGYSGHFHLAICTSNPHSLASDRKVVQILVDLRQPDLIFEIRYVLPFEKRPWRWAGGYAETIDDAVDLVIQAAAACERRPQYLAEGGL